MQRKSLARLHCTPEPAFLLISLLLGSGRRSPCEASAMCRADEITEPAATVELRTPLKPPFAAFSERIQACRNLHGQVDILEATSREGQCQISRACMKLDLNVVWLMRAAEYNTGFGGSKDVSCGVYELTVSWQGLWALGYLSSCFA